MHNVAKARRIIEQIPTGALDGDLLHPDFKAWTITNGTLPGAAYLAGIERLAKLFVPPLVFDVVAVTDGGDRVAVEATSSGVLPDRTTYSNSYHFAFVFENGQLRELREYLDPGPVVTQVRPFLLA